MHHEFHDHLDLSPEEETLLENHSLLNLFNILELQLAGLAVELPESGIHKYSRFCLDILLELSRMDIREQLSDMQAHCKSLRSHLNDLRGTCQGSRKILDGLIETTNIGHARLEEFLDERTDWKPVSRKSIESTLRTFLEATSTVSGERFDFSFSPEPQRQKSYWIDFKFGIKEEEFDAPSTINDIIRDLVSNSRKYSEPGSAIRIQMDPIAQGGLKLSVRDEGIGIPPEELSTVIQYGYRASNAFDRRTMGGGLGLTKAYQLCRSFNGRFIIESEIGKGTLLTVTFFPPS